VLTSAAICDSQGVLCKQAVAAELMYGEHPGTLTGRSSLAYWAR
jgi:hypothetical protein